MPELLEVEKLRMQFRTEAGFGARFLNHEDGWIDAVLDVSFKMTTGQTMALVGESGSGKTTLGRAIIGLLRPQEGSIKFQGTELVGLGDRDYKPYRRNIGMMSQDWKEDSIYSRYRSGSGHPDVRLRRPPIDSYYF